MPATKQGVSEKDLVAMSGRGSSGDATVQLRFILYLAVACVPPLASIVLFSALGYGLEIHHWLLAHTVYSAYFGGLALFVLFILTAFDSGSWKGPFIKLKNVLTLVFLLSAGTSVIMLVRYHPWFPLAVFLTLMPAWFIIIFRIESFLSNGSDGLGASVVFMNRLKFPMGFASVLTIVLWGALLASDSSVFDGFIRPQNDTDVEDAFNKFSSGKANNSLCPGNYNSYSSNATKVDILQSSILEKQEDQCFPELLLWFAPMVVGATMLELTVMVALLAQKVPFSLEHSLKDDETFLNMSPHVACKIAMCEACLRVATCIILSTIMVTYTVNTLAGFNVKAAAAANAIMFFMFNSLLVIFGFLLAAMSDINLDQLPLWRDFTSSWYFVWFMGIIALGMAPFLFFYLMINKLNQMLRRLLNCEDVWDEEAEDKVGKELDAAGNDISAGVSKLTGGHVDMKKMSRKMDLLDYENRNWTEIVVCALWLGIGMVMMQVGIARVVTLFLSWLNATLAPLPIPLILLIFICVGLCMFMIPVIPGVPVYLSGGIIITGATQESLGFWNAVMLSTFVCYGLKLIAVVLQQLLIGGGLRQSAAVRQMVGVNSLTIRAIKFILERPGVLKIDKVAILCGGPDWPTSVLTGILGLKLGNMLIGSAPVYFVIAPTCFSSAMLLKTGGEYAAMAAIIVAVAGVMQIGASLVAVFYITKTIDANKEELEAYPIDKEVEELDKQALQDSDNRYEAINWQTGFLDLKTKMMLCVSLVLMSLSCYIFFLYGEDCFHAFELTDSIEEDLDGSALNLVKPLGWVGMGLFTAACIMFKLFFMKTARIMRGLQDGTLVHKDITMREKPAKQVIISPTAKKAIV